MRALVIHNPAAGQRDKTEDLDQMVDFLRSQNWDILAVETTRKTGDATIQARNAAAAGCDVVFVAGGDGTVAQVVDGLVGTNTAVAVLPGGTGNVMARQLGLPVSGALRPRPLFDSVQLLLQGEVRPVDVGRVELSGGRVHHFLCWCGIGFDAQVTRTVGEQPARKQRLGALAFIVTAVLTLWDFAGRPAVLRIDGHRLRRRVIMLVANNIQLYGVWLKIAPRAIVDDGWLDVFCFEGRGTARTVLHGLRLLANRHLQDPDVVFYRAHRLEIMTSRPLPVQIDGDAIGQTPVALRILPHALKMLVPPCAPPELFAQSATERDTAAVWQWDSRRPRHLWARIRRPRRRNP
jgi:diacylglycerol kinase (ATP)